MKWYETVYAIPILILIGVYVTINDRKRRYFTTAPRGRETPQPNNTRVSRFVQNMVGFID